MFPFGDDVVQFVVLLSQSATPAAVRAAIEANPSVMAFATAPTAPASRPETPSAANSRGATPSPDEAVVDPALSGYVAICEVAPPMTAVAAAAAAAVDADGSATAPAASTVIATTEPAALLQRLALSSSGGFGNGGVGGEAESITGVPVSCVLLSKRANWTTAASSSSSSSSAPLTVRDLQVQSIDLTHPLDALQQLLQSVYDPLLSVQKSQAALQSQVLDLLSGIRSQHEVLPEVNLRRFVHEDLLSLCDANPGLDVPQLIDRVGEEKAHDPSFVRQVLQVRNRCSAVLPLEALLSGKLEDDATGTAAAGGGGGGNSNTSTDVGGNRMAHTDPTTCVVQEKLLYWQRVHVWIEGVQKQIQSREWRFVHRFLAHRVTTSYAPEYVTYAQQVREYMKYLQGIPEKALTTVDDRRFLRTVDDVFASLMRPSRYPPQLVLRLLDGIVSEMAWAWVRLAERRRLLTPSKDVADWAAGNSAAWRWPQAPTASLRALREVMASLQVLQTRYLQAADTLRTQARILASSTNREALEHPLVAALYRRCITVREFIERHYALMEQLRVVLSTRVQLPSAVTALGAQSTAGDAAYRDEVVAMELQQAYDTSVRRICDDPQGSVLWQTTIPSQVKRFEAATAVYVEERDRCDEQLASWVTHLFTTELDTASGGLPSSPGGGAGSSTGRRGAGGGGGGARESGDRGLRMFRVYANFRFVPLERVQRVVQGYQGPVMERVTNYVQHLQEQLLSTQVTGREARYRMERFHVSSLAAQVLWHLHLAESLRACVVRRDYVSEHGWHQLLSLRNVEHYWRLDKTLADFIGYPLDDLVTKELVADSTVHGSAYALAYLSLIYPEDERDWSADPYLRDAQQLVQSEGPTSFQAARERLLLVGAAHAARTDRSKLREIRSMQATVAKLIEEKTIAWCEGSHRRISSYPLISVTSPIFDSCVLRIVEVGIGTSVMTGAAAGQSGQLNATSGTVGVGRSVSAGWRQAASPPSAAMSQSMGSLSTPLPGAGSMRRLVLDVAFPWELLTMAEDMRALDGVRLLPAHSTIFAATEASATAATSLLPSATLSSLQPQVSAIKEFVRLNEPRGRLALCLAELLRIYYLTVRGEDESLVLLATDEYDQVNQCLMRGFRLRWADDAALLQYVQELAERIQSFCLTVQQVREKTEVVLYKIRGLHLRPFHPAAIALRVAEINRVVNSLAVRCINAHLWVRRTQPLLEAALMAQLQLLLRAWTLDFLSMRNDIRFLDKSRESEVFHLKPLRVRMQVVYKEVRLETPAAAWRDHWISRLNEYVAWLAELPRLNNESAAAGDMWGGGGGGAAAGAAAAAAASGNGEASGYLHLLERLPANVFAEPLQAIEQCVNDAVQVENDWRRSQQFLNLDISVMQQRFGNDLRRWSTALQLMHTVTSQLMDYTQPNKLLGGIVILAEDAQMELGRKLDQVTQYTHAKFKDVLESELHASLQLMTAERSKMDALDVISDPKDAATFLCEVPRLKQQLSDREAYVDLMVDAEAGLQALGFLLPEQWVHASSVKEEFRSVKELIQRKMKAVEVRRPFLLDSVSQDAQGVDAKCTALRARVTAVDDATAKSAPAATLRHITELHEQAVALNDEAKRITGTQEALGLPLADTATVARLVADTEQLREVWSHVATAYTKLNELGATPFFEMVPRILIDDLQALQTEIESFPESVHTHPIYEELAEQVRRVLSYRRLMQELRSDAMAPLERARRHWISLKQELHVPWQLDELTVKDIWDSDPGSHAVVYNGVVEMAQGERRIEVQLQNISSFWESFTFSLTVYKKQVALLRGWDDVFERLTDDLSTFAGMRASPYFSSQQVVAMTNESENRLNQLRQVLETLLEVQKKYVYLDGIFSGNSEIRVQLPHDTVQFDRTTRELLHHLPRPRASGEVPEVKAQFFLEDDKLLATLERISSQLTAVQRALTTYLDTQRRRFPRFFFVGDDDLLEILGNSKDPTFMNKHLKKMFTAMGSLIMDVPHDAAASTVLRGFASSEGEEVFFNGPSVRFRDRPLYDWLREVQDGMVTTLREKTISASAELVKQGTVNLDWLARYPAQMICLAVQIWWVQQQERLFTSDAVTVKRAPSRASGGTSPRPGPGGASVASPATEEMDRLLTQLASSVLDAGLSVAMRHRCEQVITTAVYQRDVSRTLVAKGVTSVKDFEWVRVLRVYLAAAAATASPSSSPSASSQSVVCRMADASIVHGFEYVGAYERLVQTPLTDKCYLTLMQALHTRLGGSPVGPAGTGKTETVKALGMQLGRHVLVFNCDDTFDYQAVSRIFLGLCQVGAWGCFDEFNRLEERILSALSLQIQVIQETLRAQSAEIDLNAFRVPLNPDVAIFITMNPGYAGRSNLPGNLKQLFRVVTMTVPDRETIAEVMLFAQGFHTAEQLSLKVVPLFRLCEDQFSRQAHYDFGLRALKSVLIAAGDRKRRSRARGAALAAATTPTKGGSAPESEESVEDEECNLMLESIIATIAPKLVTSDVALFYPLLKDFFPNRTLPTLPMREIRNAVQELCEEHGLVATPALVEKVCQLYHTKDTRHGVMVVGPSGTGKTTAWKLLMAAMVRVDPLLEMQAYVIEPKVLTKGELFGSLDITTREWKDGVFTAVLRRILETEQLLKERQQQQQQQHQQAATTPTESQPPTMVARLRSGLPPMAPNTASAVAPASGPTRRSYWVVFDGDVDPQWVENLNSVLDDNKILTLPNGERLPLPPSMRILFEVQNLRYATPATVSRCGMLWFSEGLIPLSNVLALAYHQLKRKPIADLRGRRVPWSMEEDLIGVAGSSGGGAAGGGGGGATASAMASATAASGNGPLLSGRCGKLYHEYILSSASAGMEMLLYGNASPPPTTITVNEGNSTTRDGSFATPSEGLQEDSSAPRTPHRSAAAEDTVGGDGPSILSETARPQAWSPSARATAIHPDAHRIQSALLDAWASAFAPDGLIVHGLQLLGRSPFREACIMEYEPQQLLQGILALLLESIWKAFQAEQESGTPLSATALERLAGNALSYAVFWGLGSPLSHDNRNRLAKELRMSPSVGGAARPMVEVEVNHQTGEWQLVRERVAVREILAQQVGANDTVIPTTDTCRHEDLLTGWLSAGRSAILCGPPGSGKTMSITAVLHASPEYDAVFLNFSSGTSVDTLLKALEQYCTVTNTANGLVMAPTSGKRLLLFCDEINLPALDSYGTQVVVQMLRQLIERRGFFRARDNAWVTVQDVQIVGACNPPTDPGRVPLSTRFLRWAPVLLVDFPSPDSLQIIYETYCRAILHFNHRLLTDCAEPLAQAMVRTYLASQRHFTPLQQPHYLYSPRELSRWSRAIYEGFSTWDEAEKRSMSTAALVRLAVHEGLRVFSDRLVTAEERTWTDRTIDECFHGAFPSVPAETYTRPLLYSTLLSHAYSDSPREALRTLLQKRLNAFCEEEMSAPLVVFDALIDHVVRIDRVLRQPLGHVLLAGSSGVGKSVTARLVAWMGGYAAFWLKVHRDYDLEDFEEDLRAVLRRSGCKRERICFIFDESNILQPAFLEYMNALLASGEVPGLFDGEEWVKLMQDIREAVTATYEHGVTAAGGGAVNARNAMASAAAGYVDPTSEQDLYGWFLQNVREHLHVIFTINPATGEFSSRTVASPALFNRCTIDWYGDWDHATLIQITQERTRGLTLLPACGFAFATEEAAHAALVDALCQVHEGTQELNTALRTRHANQGTFITPRHFSDCVANFVNLFNEKSGGSVEQLKHLRNGLRKLSETAEEVATQRATLQDSETAMAESSTKAQTMLERIITETDTTQKEKAAAEALRQQLQVEQVRISEDTARVAAELSEAEPAMRDAEAALNTVKPEYLREIRAYTTPPPMVKRVLEAVVVLMGERNSEDWDLLKNAIRRDDFLSSVKAFKPQHISDAARDRVTVLMRDSKFTVEAAYRASKAAGPLLQWVIAQVQYSAIYKRVGPMRDKIDELTATRQTKLRALAEAEKVINQKEAFLQRLKTDYQATTQQITELKQRITQVSSKCERATTILSRLHAERARWESEIASFDSEARTSLGDCVLSAAFLSYIGFFDEFTRQRILLPNWTQCLQSTAIPIRAQLSVMDYLVPAGQRLGWEQAGLPNDRLCVENATIMHRGDRYPLLIDPAGTAAAFLQAFYAKQKISKASFSRPGYLKQLELAVRFGYPIIMEDAEFLDPAIMPLLNHEFRLSGGRRITRIGAQDVDLATTFMLFLLTRDANYQPTPDLAGQVCVVNFTVTLSSLQSQCLHHILQHERPDVDVKRTELMKVQGEYQLRLRVLEQDLLTSIAESEGSLLENDQLIDTLAKLKEEAAVIQTGIQTSGAAMLVIQQVESRFRPLATVLSRIFFALKRFSELSSFYRYDVRFIFRVMQDALAALPPSKKPTLSPSSEVPSGSPVLSPLETPEQEAHEAERLQLLTQYLFTLVHHRVVRGLFREDHLVLALRLAQLRSAMDPVPPATQPTPIAEAEWDWLFEGLLLHSGEAGGGAASPSSPPSLPPVLLKEGVLAVGQQGRAALAAVLEKPAFREVLQSLRSPATSPAWDKLLHAVSPVDEIAALPVNCFPRDAPAVRRAFLVSLLLYYTRRDSFLAAVTHLLHLFFDGDWNTGVAVRNDSGSTTVATPPPASIGSFFESTSHELPGVLPELSASTPLIMVADASYDPSAKVEQLARQTNVELRVVAMGSVEGATNADAFVASAMKGGGWVLLKNVHLARAYMDLLEKRLHFERLEGRLHDGFRLFLTAERGSGDEAHRAAGGSGGAASAGPPPVLPTNLLEQAIVMVYELPPGMKSSLLQTYGTMDSGEGRARSLSPTGGAVAGPRKKDLAGNATQQQRLYLAAAWLHAVITERLSYVPVGWSQVYEFNDTEFQRVVQAVQAWSVDNGAAATDDIARSTTLPTVSWEALCTVVAETVYGGKVSNAFDQFTLSVFSGQVLNPMVFEKDHRFAKPVPNQPSEMTALLPPALDSFRCARSDLLRWINALPDGYSHPHWMGLPSSVAHMVLSRRALDTLERLSLVQSTMGEEAAAGVSDLAASDTGSIGTRVNSPSARTQRRTGSMSESVVSIGSALPAVLISSLADTRWASKVRDLCARWGPVLQTLYAQLTSHRFVEAALAADRGEKAEASRASADVVLVSATAGGAAAETTPPLALAMQREVVAAVDVLRRLVTDVAELAEVCEGTRKPSSAHRALVQDLMKGRVPPPWTASLPHQAGLLIGAWLSDVQARVAHLLQLAEATASNQLHQTCIRIGLLFSPGAFLTASKQQWARQKRLPLERLQPAVEVMTEADLQSQLSKAAKTPAGVATSALHLGSVTLYSAVVNASGQCELVHATSAMTTLSSTVALRWSWETTPAVVAEPMKSGEAGGGGGAGAPRPALSLGARLAGQRPHQSRLALPMYVSDRRDALLEVVDVKMATTGEIDTWYQRGACLTAWVATE